jgi:DEAD/DEAH box helicase domain-containing protein
MDPDSFLDLLAARDDRRDSLAHLERIPAREPQTLDVAIAPELSLRLRRLGIDGLWTHQARALEHARAGRNVCVSTGTASGKTLVYQLAIAERLAARKGSTAIAIYPTKALAQDQLRQFRALALTTVRAAVYDGDTPSSERAWIRANANLVITNPDMLHYGILPQHERWTSFLRGLSGVVVDEMHGLRGVFGSHVAGVLRRLRRLAAKRGADPLFVGSSATIGNPADLGERLTGLPFTEVTEDGSPRGEKLFALWNPPLVDEQSGARRSANAEAAMILARLAETETRTIAFAKSRKGAELIARFAREALADAPHHVAGRIESYRAGYLPEERREIEAALVGGELLGVAATNALELGIDIGGLDACLLAGYPGTVASTWQQAGRAGRARRKSLAILVGQDDPLDQYLLTHPEELFGRPHENAIVDHSNPNILEPHLACAAYESALEDGDEAFFGPAMHAAIERLVAKGTLRKRGRRYVYAGAGSPAQDVDIRSTGGIVRIAEADTGALLGTVDYARAPATVHRGAVYLHRGEQFRVESLDLDAGVAFVVPSEDDYYTQSRDITDIRVLEVMKKERVGRVDLHFGRVDVTNQVVAFARKRMYSGEIIDVTPLDLPEMRLDTRAVWYEVAPALLDEAGVSHAAVAGAAHAAEHCAIGLLPLFAMCDRWDIGGVSFAEYPDTGLCTVFVYDGYPGGAGIAERGFEAGEDHLRATLQRIRECPCASGCPSCVQSPKCGNGNEPLDKDGAARLLAAVLGDRGRRR